MAFNSAKTALPYLSLGDVRMRRAAFKHLSRSAIPNFNIIEF